MATDRRSKLLRLYETHQAVENIIKHGGQSNQDSGGNVQGGASVAGVLNLSRVPWTLSESGLRTLLRKVYLNA